MLRLNYNVVTETRRLTTDWIPDLRIINSSYRFIVVYPLVELDKLIKRNEKRSASIGRYVDPHQIKEDFELAQSNLLSVLKDIDELYIFNNNFDSNIDKITEPKEVIRIIKKRTSDKDKEFIKQTVCSTEVERIISILNANMKDLISAECNKDKNTMKLKYLKYKKKYLALKKSLNL